MAETDLFKQLRPLSYRGIVVPIMGRQVGFQHDAVRHKFVFRDRELIEALGARNLTFSYRIPMRDGIALGPYSGLFTFELAKFFDAILDRSAGILIDPIHGQFWARSVSYSENLDVAKRDGVDLEIQFVHSPKSDAVIEAGAGLSSISAAVNDAHALEAEIERVDWQQEPPPESLFDPFAVAAGLGDQIGGIGDKFAANMDKIAHNMNKLSDSVERLEDAEAWPVRQSAKRIGAAATRLKRTGGNPAVKIYEFTLAAHSTISSVANTLGTTTEELLAMNESLAASPVVPKGTVVKHKGADAEAA